MSITIPGSSALTAMASTTTSTLVSAGTIAAARSNKTAMIMAANGNVEFTNDITIQGRSLSAILDKVCDRLAILEPSTASLEKQQQFESLKLAYENYKTVERLLAD